MRTETIGDATLYLGDCREILPTLGKVDAVVTDPPYGVNFRGWGWDDAIPDFWLAAAREVAPLVVFTTAPTTCWDYPRPDWVFSWQRPGAQSRTIQGGFNHWSPILVYGWRRVWVDSIWLPSMQNREESGFEHPSPKPLALMQWLVDSFTDDHQTILDPFMGSGTTGVACAKLGRKFIGIEIEPKYFDIACRRIDEAYRQPRLFKDEAPKAKQGALAL